MKLRRVSLTEYEVQSESDHLPYIVELLANNGLSSCSCKDFTVRHRPKQKLHNDLNDESYEHVCKHIRQARKDFYISVIRQLKQR